jgi:hypothetical protein
VISDTCPCGSVFETQQRMSSPEASDHERWLAAHSGHGPKPCPALSPAEQGFKVRPCQLGLGHGGDLHHWRHGEEAVTWPVGDQTPTCNVSGRGVVCMLPRGHVCSNRHLWLSTGDDEIVWWITDPLTGKVMVQEHLVHGEWNRGDWEQTP